MRMKNTKEDRTQILESMPVNKAIWTLAIPTILAMLVQVIYNMTDTFYIGQLNEPNMVAAISISMPIVMLVQAFGNMFGIGGSSLISRLLGQQERENANHAGAIAFWSALVVIIVGAIVGLIFSEPILKTIGASGSMLEYGKTYLRIMLMGGPLIGMQMLMGGLLRSEGATRNAMVGMMTGSVLNMILDPIFILVLDMGITGAALATIIGNFVGFSYNISFYLRKKGLISVSIKNYIFDKKYYAAIFKIGLPASFGMILMSLGMSTANRFAASFGDASVAAFGVVMRITNIAIMVVMGLAQGCQPLMGYSYGAKKYDRLFATIKRAMLIGTILGVTFAVLFNVFADSWIRVFINDQAVIDRGVIVMRAFTFGMPFVGVQMILMVMFQALGKTVQSLVISLGRQGLFMIPSIIILSTVWGFNGLAFALPLADLLTTILAFTLFMQMRKKMTVFTQRTLQ